MPEVLLQAKTRICTLNGLLRWLPNSLNGAIAGIVGEGYWKSNVKIANNEQFAALTKEIYAQLNQNLSEAVDDVSKFAVEVYVKIGIDSKKGALKAIYAFQINLFRLVSTLGGAPLSEEKPKQFMISFVGSKEDTANTPPWKAVLTSLKTSMRMIAKIEFYYQEDGLPSKIREEVGKKQLPVLLVGDELYDAAVSMREKRALPSLVVDGRNKTFYDPEELKTFLTERIEPTLTFVRSRAGHESVDEEVKKFRRVLGGVLENRKIQEPSVLPSLQTALREADRIITAQETKQQSTERFKQVEKAKRVIEETKTTLKQIAIELKTVNQELVNLERKLARNLISYPMYSPEHTKFLNRKNELESEISEMLTRLNEVVLQPFKVRR